MYQSNSNYRLFASYSLNNTSLTDEAVNQALYGQKTPPQPWAPPPLLPPIMNRGLQPSFGLMFGYMEPPFNRGPR